VEQYFADENIIHDTFMLKHVRRNRLGFVSLKLVTSFRKVKPLTRDHRAVAYSLRQLSEKLEVNEDGTKVRRRDPLPEFDETTPSRSLIVAGLPMEVPTMENISEMLTGCGEIVSIRIWRAGKPLPSDVKKHVNNLGAEYLATACAVVEFDAHESAVKACENLVKAGNGEQVGKMKASLLAASKGEKVKKSEKGTGQAQKRSDRESANENWRDGSNQSPDSRGKPVKDKKDKGSSNSDWRKSSRVDELTHDDPAHDSAGSESDASSENWRLVKRNAEVKVSRSSLSPQVDPNRLSPCQSPRTTPKSSPKSSPRTSPNARRRTLGTSPLAVEADERRKSDGGATSPSHSPWVQRRLKAQVEASISPLAGNTPGSSPRLARKAGNEDSTAGIVSRLSDAVGVIRQPRGPDGTRGFGGGLGRGWSVAGVGSTRGIHTALVIRYICYTIFIHTDPCINQNRSTVTN
jgi:la-related protein 6